MNTQYSTRANQTTHKQKYQCQNLGTLQFTLHTFYILHCTLHTLYFLLRIFSLRPAAATDGAADNRVFQVES